MSTFKNLLENSLITEDTNFLRELILDYYVSEHDELIGESEEELAFEGGLDIIYELADIFTPEQVDIIAEKILELSGLDESGSGDYPDDDDEIDEADDDDEDDDEMDEAKRFRIIKKKDKRKLALKKKAIGKLGKEKAGSAEFRAKKVFDPKKKRFVPRKKKRSVAVQKRMDRKMTKRLKRRRKARGH